LGDNRLAEETVPVPNGLYAPSMGKLRKRLIQNLRKRLPLPHRFGADNYSYEISLKNYLFKCKKLMEQQLKQAAKATVTLTTCVCSIYKVNGRNRHSFQKC
jgi:hypothetical protein